MAFRLEFLIEGERDFEPSDAPQPRREFGSCAQSCCRTSARDPRDRGANPGRAGASALKASRQNRGNRHPRVSMIRTGRFAFLGAFFGGRDHASHVMIRFPEERNALPLAPRRNRESLGPAIAGANRQETLTAPCRRFAKERAGCAGAAPPRVSRMGRMRVAQGRADAWSKTDDRREAAPRLSRAMVEGMLCSWYVPNLRRRRSESGTLRATTDGLPVSSANRFERARLESAPRDAILTRRCANAASVDLQTPQRETQNDQGRELEYLQAK